MTPFRTPRRTRIIRRIGLVCVTLGLLFRIIAGEHRYLHDAAIERAVQSIARYGVPVMLFVSGILLYCAAALVDFARGDQNGGPF